MLAVLYWKPQIVQELGNFMIFSSYTCCFPVYRSELLYNSIFVLALSAPDHLL